MLSTITVEKIGDKWLVSFISDLESKSLPLSEFDCPPITDLKSQYDEVLVNILKACNYDYNCWTLSYKDGKCQATFHCSNI